MLLFVRNLHRIVDGGSHLRLEVLDLNLHSLLNIFRAYQLAYERLVSGHLSLDIRSERVYLILVAFGTASMLFCSKSR
jgi:hypothetical protein